MANSKINIDHIAKLANLIISGDEKQKYEKQLVQTLDYIHKLDEIKTEGVEPTSQVTGLENVLREDKIMPSLSQEDVLKNTKSTQDGSFKVKAILGEL